MEESTDTIDAILADAQEATAFKEKAEIIGRLTQYAIGQLPDDEKLKAQQILSLIQQFRTA